MELRDHLSARIVTTAIFAAYWSQENSELGASCLVNFINSLRLLALNQVSNISQLENKSGIKKFSRLHNSWRLFYSGVPVRRIL